MGYRVSERYGELGQKVLESHDDLSWILERGVSIGFLESDKEKKSKGRIVRGECIRPPELYRDLLPYDFLIVIYDNCIGDLIEEQLEILMYHELLHIGLDGKGVDAKLTVTPHNLEDFREVVEQYGPDWDKPKE